MGTRQGKSQAQSNNHNNRIAQATFAEAELRGITDRKFLEESTRKAIQRLEGVLPGMEELVPSRGRHTPSASQIEAAVKEILDMKTKMAESPMPETKPKTMPGVELRENALIVLEKRYLEKDSQDRKSVV